MDVSNISLNEIIHFEAEELIKQREKTAKREEEKNSNSNSNDVVVRKIQRTLRKRHLSLMLNCQETEI